MALNNQDDFISIINATGHSTVEMVKYYVTRDSLKKMQYMESQNLSE